MSVVSDSVRPHRQQPTRLPSLGFSGQAYWSGLPFPSPVQESEKWKWSCSVVSDSSRPHGLQPTRLLHPWDFPGKSTGVGCHCLLHVDGHLGCFHTVAGLPRWLKGQESTFNGGDVGSIPGSGTPLGGGHGNSLQYSCLEKPWTEAPVHGLQSIGLQRVGHDWSERIRTHEHRS